MATIPDGNAAIDAGRSQTAPSYARMVNDTGKIIKEPLKLGTNVRRNHVIGTGGQHPTVTAAASSHRTRFINRPHSLPHPS